jgi:hypothetical protein
MPKEPTIETNNESDIEEWYLRARYRFVWDKDTFEKYLTVVSEVVKQIIQAYDAPRFYDKLVSPNIGIFSATDTKDPQTVIGYALYISDARLARDKRRTLFSDFKSTYEISVGRGMADEMLRDETLIRKLFVDNAERIIQRKRERRRLVGNFNLLAHKSINHRRAISTRLRYEILRRDNFTCQSCGRRAPEVRLHIDHKKPVSWGVNWESSDNPNDYQILCEDCNLGKGDLSWMYES